MGKTTDFTKQPGTIKDVDRNDVIDIVIKVVKVIGDLLRK